MKHLFDKIAIFQRKTTTRDANGQPADTWKDYIITDVFFHQVSGEKRFQSDKSGLFSTHILECAVFDITESDRVVVDSKTYQIMNVNQPNKADFLQVDVRRAV